MSTNAETYKMHDGEVAVASLGHLSVLIMPVSIVLLIIAYALASPRWRFASHHLAQALVWQIGMTVVIVLLSIALVVTAIAGGISLSWDATAEGIRIPPAPSWPIIAVIVLAILIGIVSLALWIGGLVAAVIALQRNRVRYPIFGGIADRMAPYP